MSKNEVDGKITVAVMTGFLFFVGLASLLLQYPLQQ